MGPQGTAGADGATGPQGTAGIDGATGATGATGVDGAMGPQGTAGVDGADGNQGPTGPVGPQGVQGIQGAQGIQGLRGPTGATGVAGATGPPGAVGGALTATSLAVGGGTRCSLVQSGSIPETHTIAGGANIIETIIFPVAFSIAPTVFVGIQFLGATIPQYGQYLLAAAGGPVTPTSCLVTVTNAINATFVGAFSIVWYAFV
jgi:hypothetical protein